VEAVRAFVVRYKAVLVLALAVLLAIVSLRIVNGLTAYRIQIPLDSAAGLYAGSDVLIAGARAGTVDDIQPDGGLALVTVTLDDAFAPVHTNARATVRPKSLLGEKYIALDPGSGDNLPSGARLPTTQVAEAVELQDVVNSLDAPTREKLRTLVIELGGGLAGQGYTTNQTIAFGRQDMDSLATIANTLAARDADLQQVIQGLNQVTAELASSDRRQQLGGLIQNSETLLHSLAAQDAQIQQMLAATDAALGRSNTALSGTATQLNDIFQQAPQTVALLSGLTADLGSGMDGILQGNNLQVFDAGMKYGPNVFGASASDGSGNATRISITTNQCATPSPCSTSGTSGGTALLPNSFDAVMGVLLGGKP
jgi:phospholipid/cholesterol/gamma-HCH transport system substrate-binding protein